MGQGKQQQIFKTCPSEGNGGGLIHLSHTKTEPLCFVLHAEIPALVELCNKQVPLPQLRAGRQRTSIDVLSLGSLPSRRA